MSEQCRWLREALGLLTAAMMGIVAISPVWGQTQQELVAQARTSISNAGGVPLAYPAGVKRGLNGNLYAADTGNGRILEISSTGKVLRAIGKPGSGPGELNSPADVAVDAKGNLYVADTMNNRIVHFGPNGDFVKAWGKPGEIGSPYGIALGADGRLYVTDTLAHRILVFDSEGRSLASWGKEGSGPGQLRFPHGIVAGKDAIYVADFLNNRVDKLTLDGKFVAALGRSGSGPGELDQPWGVDLDGEGNVWVADMGNNRLQRFSRDGKSAILSSEGREGSLRTPKAVAIAPRQSAGSLTVVIGHAGRNSIDFVTLNPGQTVAKKRAPQAQTQAKVLGLSVTRRITRLQPISTAKGLTPQQSSELRFPVVARSSGSGQTFVTDTGNHRIVVLDAAGAMSGSWGHLGSGKGDLNTPSDLVLDSEGNVLVADTFNNAVKRFSPRGELLSVIGGKPELNAPQGLAIGADGSLYVADTLGHRIVKYDRAGKMVTAWGGPGSGVGQFQFPHGLAVHGNSLYVADFQNDRVVELSLDGRFVRSWGQHGTGPGQFRYPWGVAVGPDGDIWVTDMSNGRIQRFDFQGKLVGVFGSEGRGLGQFDHLKGIDLTKKGELVVGVTGLHSVDFLTGAVARRR